MHRGRPPGRPAPAVRGPELRIRYHFGSGGSCRAIGPAADGWTEEEDPSRAEAIRTVLAACIGPGGRAAARTVSVRLAFTASGRVFRVVIIGDFQGAAAACIDNAIRVLTLPPDIRGPVEVELNFDLLRWPDLGPSGRPLVARDSPP